MTHGPTDLELAYRWQAIVARERTLPVRLRRWCAKVLRRWSVKVDPR
jgi:hypothetical protein